MPLAVGYTIFKSEEPSPSFFRRIQHDWRPAWATAIEYAIWWDWDIGHLYELEHVWVYLDEADRLVWVEASSHGGYASMILEDGSIPCDGTHPIVYAQPGTVMGTRGFIAPELLLGESATAATDPGDAVNSWAALPDDGDPVLELLAERHAARPMSLFAS